MSRRGKWWLVAVWGVLVLGGSGVTLWLNGGGGTSTPEPEFGWFPMGSTPVDSTPTPGGASQSPCPGVAPTDQTETVLPEELGDPRRTVTVIACAEGSGD